VVPVVADIPVDMVEADKRNRADMAWEAASGHKAEAAFAGKAEAAFAEVAELGLAPPELPEPALGPVADYSPVWLVAKRRGPELMIGLVSYLCFVRLPAFLVQAGLMLLRLVVSSRVWRYQEFWPLRLTWSTRHT
jgi:hypothetical protein